LKHHQQLHLVINGVAVSIEGRPAGHMVGGTVWLVESGGEVVVYGVDTNHMKERCATVAAHAVAQHCSLVGGLVGQVFSASCRLWWGNLFSQCVCCVLLVMLVICCWRSGTELHCSGPCHHHKQHIDHQSSPFNGVNSCCYLQAPRWWPAAVCPHKATAAHSGCCQGALQSCQQEY
jgi:hypothetical protein